MVFVACGLNNGKDNTAEAICQFEARFFLKKCLFFSRPGRRSGTKKPRMPS
jgi:hypothetical protein